MFCPSLSRKSEGRRKLTSLPWSESIASEQHLSRENARGRSDPESTYKQNLLREKQAKEEEKEERREDKREE